MEAPVVEVPVEILLEAVLLVLQTWVAVEAVEEQTLLTTQVAAEALELLFLVTHLPLLLLLALV
jgi:hypothetical protein